MTKRNAILGKNPALWSLILASGLLSSLDPAAAKIRTSTRLHPAPRGAQMGWNRVMPEVMRSFFADFRAWPS
jgi:hypothetical protein